MVGKSYDRDYACKYNQPPLIESSSFLILYYQAILRVKPVKLNKIEHCFHVKSLIIVAVIIRVKWH